MGHRGDGIGASFRSARPPASPCQWLPALLNGGCPAAGGGGWAKFSGISSRMLAVSAAMRRHFRARAHWQGREQAGPRCGDVVWPGYCFIYFISSISPSRLHRDGPGRFCPRQCQGAGPRPTPDVSGASCACIKLPSTLLGSCHYQLSFSCLLPAQLDCCAAPPSSRATFFCGRRMIIHGS
jgi:hypothetical protein